MNLNAAFTTIRVDKMDQSKPHIPKITVKFMGAVYLFKYQQSFFFLSRMTFHL